jgi:hypothetical protein
MIMHLESEIQKLAEESTEVPGANDEEMIKEIERLIREENEYIAQQ